MILKDHWHWKLGSNDAENSALISGINYIIKYIQIENGYFKGVLWCDFKFPFSWSVSSCLCIYKICKSCKD